MSHDSNNLVMFYVPVGSCEQGEKLARRLIELRLAACVNIIPKMKSVYFWEGSIETSSESILIVKTLESCANACGEKIEELHEYDTPCVTRIQLAGTNKKFTEWARGCLA